MNLFDGAKVPQVNAASLSYMIRPRVWPYLPVGSSFTSTICQFSLNYQQSKLSPPMNRIFDQGQITLDGNQGDEYIDCTQVW